MPTLLSADVLDGLTSRADAATALVEATDFLAAAANAAAEVRSPGAEPSNNPVAQLTTAGAPDALLRAVEGIWSFRAQVLDPDVPMEISHNGAVAIYAQVSETAAAIRVGRRVGLACSRIARWHGCR
ncbi:hypothetical protein [Rhodococcus sp. 14-2496-1d]|uniref:hypothetical protein n=1 Tax=Rhodococcus sp. 14-2496-1d TaxID=2023146 RepID=UPI001179DBE7|nr:hypothetical protein [Rhodococcus sp. 14-2496-1d]